MTLQNQVLASIASTWAPLYSTNTLLGQARHAAFAGQKACVLQLLSVSAAERGREAGTA